MNAMTDTDILIQIPEKTSMHRQSALCMLHQANTQKFKYTFEHHQTMSLVIITTDHQNFRSWSQKIFLSLNFGS